ncbi:pyrroloquinoline quinone biosynthesis protein PqqF [Erwinia sp. CGal63]|uniref:pyrroloquinoline quinone biosynthesis protein PqqF n=1 Tax=Erwinia sp. CGal63 TaxID=2919889 RepID=UPI003007F754
MNDPASFCVVNGLRITLIHEPEAERAAALFRLSAGSFDEPPAWPGLAHLLEHVLFAGSEGFQQQQRLMAWAPVNGARLNATTLAHHTAWFVEIAPERLSAALERLTDMLARPLLTTEAITAESAAIEAEYQMLQSHGPTLGEAALSRAFAAPHPLHDFHVGSLHHFGDDAVALRQALQAYHQRFFHTGNLELWLSGPQPLTTLKALAEKAASAFPCAAATPADVPLLQFASQRAFVLQSAADQQLQLSFLLDAGDPASLTLLRELLLDKAQDSLLATLRERQLCDDISLLVPYRGPRQSVLSVMFQSPRLAQCAVIEALFRRWLARLPELTLAQLSHYATLTQRRFSQLSALDRLRELALGFAPAKATTALPLPQGLSRLWVSPAASAPVTQAQGFPLRLTAIDWPQPPAQPLPAMRFYSPSSAPAAPPAPIAPPCPLQRFKAAGEPALLLSVQPGQTLCRRTAATFEAALQPAMGAALHGGGELVFSRQDGQWLLRLSGNGALIASTLDRALAALVAPSASSLAYGERLFDRARQADDIAIRCLLAHLPDLLVDASSSTPCWQATFYGGTDKEAATLARSLSRLPGVIEPPKPLPTISPAQSHFVYATTSQDGAALVFCPLTEASSACFTHWQLLAMLFEPHFFQQLRIEANIGYVVSCRFHQTAGQAGLLFALQSPSLRAAELFRHIERFIAGMAETVAGFSAAALEKSLLALQHNAPPAVPKTPQQITAHWRYQQLRLAASAVEPSSEGLQLAYRQLTGDRSCWWFLSNDT